MANKTVCEKINEFISQLGDNFDSVMTSYFQNLKKTLRGRRRIPVSLVEKHLKDVYFLVDTNFIYV